MGVATGVLARFGRSGALPRWIQPGLERFPGVAQILTTRETATGFLGLDDVTVPYAERSGLLGLGAFPLALDGDEHATAREFVEGVLEDTDEQHRRGVAAASEVADEQVAAATGSRLEVVGAVVEPALTTWIEEWYGLAGQGTNLLRAGRLIAHATFLNPKVPGGRYDVQGLGRAITLVDDYRPPLAAAMDAAGPHTVARGLIEATGDPSLAAGHLLGLTVGPLALGTWAVVNVVDALLDQPWTLDSVTTAADGEAAFTAALRRRPPLQGVLRNNPRPRTLDLPPNGGQSGGQIEVPPGLVLVHTECAAHLDDADAGAGAPLPPELPFGIGVHACLGQRQITEVAEVVLRALGARSPRRVDGRRGRVQPGPAPSGVSAKSWGFPGRLEVDLLR